MTREAHPLMSWRASLPPLPPLLSLAAAHNFFAPASTSSFPHPSSPLSCLKDRLIWASVTSGLSAPISDRYSVVKHARSSSRSNVPLWSASYLPRRDG